MSSCTCLDSSLAGLRLQLPTSAQFKYLSSCLSWGRPGLHLQLLASGSP